MSDLLQNDNITAYLFKKDNFKANTGLRGSGVAASEEKSLSSEQYGASKIVLNSHIFTSDISFNLTADKHYILKIYQIIIYAFIKVYI